MGDSRANAIVVFSADNYNTTRERLMGRQSATEGFLRALVRHGGLDEFWCYCLRREDLEIFRQRVAEFAGGPRLAQAVATMDLDSWSKVGTMYRPGPKIGHFAWLRRGFNQRAFSICGVTHTTAEHVVMDGIAESVLGPVQPWDALVCTSEPGRRAVEALLEGVAGYLHERLGAARIPPAQLVTIPLGVHAEDFRQDPAARQRWRARLDIPDDAPVALHLGRSARLAMAMPARPARTGMRTDRRARIRKAAWAAGPRAAKGPARSRLISPMAVTTTSSRGRSAKRR